MTLSEVKLKIYKASFHHINMKIITRLFILSFFLVSIAGSIITSVNGVDEYKFKIVVDHDFDDDEEIRCDIRYDDSKKTLRFNDDSSYEDLEYENYFEEKLDISCDDELDKITLYIYDRKDKLFDKKSYKYEDKIIYYLEQVDKDNDWFEIIIQHDFSSKITCDLTIDGKSPIEFVFDEDTEDKSLTIQRNYKDNMDFECNKQIDTIRLRVYDDEENKIYEEKYTDKKTFSYEYENSEYKYELRFDIKHSFDNKVVDCDLIIDDDNEFEFEFDKYSDSSDLKIVKNFKKKFEFKCNYDLDNIDLRVYDEDGDKIDQQTYKNEDKITYKANNADYDFLVEIFNEFASRDEIECDIYIDSVKQRKNYIFSSNSKRSDLRIENEFAESFEVVCNQKLDKFSIMIFSSNNDKQKDELIDSKEHQNVKTVKYDINEEHKKDSQSSLNNPSSNSANEQQVNIIYANNEQFAINSSKSNEDMNNLKEKENITLTPGISSSQTTDSDNFKVSKSFNIIVLTILLLVIVCIIGFLLLKLDVIKIGSNNTKKHLNRNNRNVTKKDNFGIDFIKKKK